MKCSAPSATARHLRVRALSLPVAALAAALLAGCASGGSQRPDDVASCSSGFSQRLDLALDEARERLDNGCRDAWGPMLERLLAIGEGDPKPENKRLFSDYLGWASDEGYLSPRQARETYTRYFGTKFVSALSDYNTCSAFCPTQGELLGEMRGELDDKSRGMVRIVGDRDAYSRANTLFQEMELIVTATCAACQAR